MEALGHMTCMPHAWLPTAAVIGYDPMPCRRVRVHCQGLYCRPCGWLLDYVQLLKGSIFSVPLVRG